MNLTGFSKDSKALIKRYEDNGWTFTLSNKGHAIGKSPYSDRTCSISRSLANARALKNSEAECDRNLRRDAAEKAMDALDTSGSLDPNEMSPTDRVILGGIKRKVMEDREQQFDETVTGLMDAMDESKWEVRPHSVTSNVTGPVIGGKFRPVHYLCVKCDAQFDSARSVGQHSRTCSAQGNVPQTDTLPDGAPRLADDGLDGFTVTEQMVAEAPMIGPAMPVVTDDSDVLDQVRALVAPDLVAERDALLVERDRLAATLARVEADLDALRALADAIKVTA